MSVSIPRAMSDAAPDVDSLPRWTGIAKVRPSCAVGVADVLDDLADFVDERLANPTRQTCGAKALRGAAELCGKVTLQAFVWASDPGAETRRPAEKAPNWKKSNAARLTVNRAPLFLRSVRLRKLREPDAVAQFRVVADAMSNEVQAVRRA